MACRRCAHKSGDHIFGRCLNGQEKDKPLMCPCPGWSPAPLEVGA